MPGYLTSRKLEPSLHRNAVELIASEIVNHTPMTTSHPRDPLHGVTLETIVTTLVERHGWAELGRRLPVRCFLNNPSVKSSLTFLRKTPWARERVEGMYIAELP